MKFDADNSNSDSKMDYFLRNSKKQNAFHIICANNDIEMFDYAMDNIYNKYDKKRIISMMTDELSGSDRTTFHLALKEGVVAGNCHICAQMLKFGVNPNITELDSSEITSDLDRHRINTNFIPYIADIADVMPHRSTNMEDSNVNAFKLLMNESKISQYTYDFDKWMKDKKINQKVLQSLCGNNDTQSLLYLTSLMKTGRIKTRFVKDYKALASAIGKESKSDQFASILMKYVFNNDNTSFDINRKTFGKNRNMTALSLSIANKNNLMVKAIVAEYPKECNLIEAICFYALCNDYDSIVEIINLPKLLPFIIEKNVLIQKYKDRSVLDCFVQLKNPGMSSFASMLLKLIDIYDINDMKQLSSKDNDNDNDGGCTIGEVVNDKQFEKWIGLCLENKETVFWSFLTTLYNVAWKNNNLSLFISILSKNCLESTKFQVNEEVSELSDKYQRDYKTAMYLFNNLEKDTLNDLSNVINNGLSKQACGMNDSLLFLSKMIDTHKLTKCLEKVTNQCLTNQNKTIESYTYFKNNLLDSNVWACPIKCVSENNNNNNDNNNNITKTAPVETKSNEIENDKNANVDTVNVSDSDDIKLLFDEIKSNIMDQELKIQQMFIQNNILSIETNNNKAWKRLISDEINQRLSFGREIKTPESRYNLSSLPFDNISGFDCAKEYDHNGYLTDLLISAHQMDPLFQQDCKRLFDSKAGADNVFGMPKCKYSSAPVKTKTRSITKAELDYKHKNWPHTQHLMDLVRASVVFDSIDDLLIGAQMFHEEIEKRKQTKHLRSNDFSDLGVIRSVIRVKNGFAEQFGGGGGNGKGIKIKELALSKFNYCDVKFNVDVGGMVIGEIQFLVGFMLDAKKMGHSSYSFLRKQDLFDAIYNNVNNKDDRSIQSKIDFIILNKDMKQLSNHLANMTNNYQIKYIISQKQTFLKCFEQTKWVKGKKVFESCISKWI